MTPIEIMTLILIVVAGVKLLVILIKPASWGGVIDAFYSNPNLMAVVSLVLSGIVLYYLLQEITIVQILAAGLFLALLAAVGVSVYSKEVIPLAKKMLRDRSMLGRAWLPILIWVVLIVWALKELFV